jgi:hypothetical protein
MPSAIQAGIYAILLLGCAPLPAPARIELMCLPIQARPER